MLILYRISAFLSDAHEQRMRAYMHFGTIVMVRRLQLVVHGRDFSRVWELIGNRIKTARQVGIIDTDNEGLKATQSFNSRKRSLEAEWKAWIKAETAWRRV